VDLLIQGGGFGLVILDLGDTPPATARRISLTSWFRLRRAVEHTPAVFIALAYQTNARTCASLVIECERASASWSGARGISRLLRNAGFCARSTHRRIQCTPVFTAKAI
jgi:recombination protein RecA